MALDLSLGVIGSGQLGSAIIAALLAKDAVSPAKLWVANRSGKVKGIELPPEVRVTSDSQALADACEVVLMAVPPQQFAALRIDASKALVLSVMAGVTIERLQAVSGSSRVVRAMSSPAAALSLAYSPWCASAAVTGEDRRIVSALFAACGLSDEVPNEDQIDRFTAMTGPVPGFVAFLADAMVRYATDHGIERVVAERAIKQLFLASGTMMAAPGFSPAREVQAMIDYAGTTAAGMVAMRDSPLAALIGEGLEAAVRKSKTIAD